MRSCRHIYSSKIFDTRLYILTICLIFNRSDKHVTGSFFSVPRYLCRLFLLIIRYQKKTSGFNRCLLKSMKKSQGFPFENTNPRLLGRNTQLNKCSGIFHCKTHWKCLDYNVEKLDEVCRVTFKWKKVSYSFIFNLHKKSFFLFLWISPSKKRWPVRKETISFFLSVIF